jgi:hypothetical protein
MPGTITSGRAPLAAIGLSVAILLAGCGGSSPSSGRRTAAAATTTSSLSSSNGTATRQSDATTSSTRAEASRSRTGTATPQVENTRSSSRTETTSTTATQAGRSASAANTARLRAAFTDAATKYVGCLRQHGVNVSAPHASANGPVVDTQHLNTKSPVFKRASLTCRSVAIAALRAAEKK